MDNIDDLGDINIGSGTVKMSGHHKKEPITRNFDSVEEMAKHVEETYQIGKQRENKQEIDAGFDVRDKNSVMAFDIGYTPRNGGIILKEIPKDIMPEEKGITLIELGDETIRWWVMAVGNLVVDLRKGDIVHTAGGQGIKRRFKKVLFWEMESYNVSGVYTTNEEIEKRIKKHDSKSHGSANDNLLNIVLTAMIEDREYKKSAKPSAGMR